MAPANNPSEQSILILPTDESSMTAEAQAAKAFHHELTALSDAEIDKRIAEAERLEEEAREAAHPFNAPDAIADDGVYDYWAKAAYWRVEEAVALLMARDPKVVLRETTKRGEYTPRFHPSSCGPKFEALLELAERAVYAKQIFRRTKPATILAWAKARRISVPERLEAISEEYGHRTPDWKAAYDQQVDQIKALEAQIAELADAASTPTPKPASAITRERNTLLKLVLGLAMDCYGYRPLSPRSSTASDISGALLGQGISISEDTVRKYLADAAEFAPDPTPDD